MSEARQTELLNIGYQGSTVITDTAVHNGAWKKVVPYEATVFTTLTDSLRNQVSTEDGNALEGETIALNHELTGDFTVITLASGAVVAYK